MEKIPFIAGNGKFELTAVGAKFYMDALNSIMKGATTLTEKAKLIPEDDNEYDSDAIAVEILGKKVGHLSMDDVCEYRDWIEEKTGLVQTIECDVQIRISSKYGYLIELDLLVYD